MSTDINQITIVGRLTRDAEIRYTQSGTAYCTFSIACSEDVKQSSGQWEEKAHFFDCTLWGKSAESLNQYLVKGKQVAIVGKLKQDRWEDRESGQNRSKVGISVQRLQLLGGGRDQGGYQGAPRASQGQSYGQGGYNPQSPPQPQQQSQQDDYGQGPEFFEDDQIPF